MQDPPDKAALLDAVARFLQTDLRPAMVDEALGFRVLIAAHLCGVVAREVRLEDMHDGEELARLAQLLPELSEADAGLPADRALRSERFRVLHEELARRIRDGGLAACDGALWDHLRATLREKLAVVNPRFDLSERLPGE